MSAIDQAFLKAYGKTNRKDSQAPPRGSTRSVLNTLVNDEELTDGDAEHRIESPVQADTNVPTPHLHFDAAQEDIVMMGGAIEASSFMVLPANVDEEQERLQREKLKQEQLEKERLEQFRLEKEQLERERLEQLQLEKQRLEETRLEQLRIEHERLEQERLEQLRIEQQQLEQERLEQLRREQERLEQERLEQERIEQERIERERAERERLEQERLERERLEQLRIEQERAEQERLEQERIERERAERERLEQERLERERLEQLRIEQERAEQERLEQLRIEQERIEQERIEQERIELERRERERLEQLRIEQERREQVRLEQIRLEQERVEQERIEQERLERERLEQLRLAQEQAEQERLEQLRIEQERIERERQEQVRIALERAELERAEQERLEQLQLEQERIEQERLERERQEQLRIEQERAEQVRAEQERREQLRVAQEQLAEQKKLHAERAEQERLRQAAALHLAPPSVIVEPNYGAITTSSNADLPPSTEQVSSSGGEPQTVVPEVWNTANELAPPIELPVKEEEAWPGKDDEAAAPNNEAQPTVAASEDTAAATERAAFAPAWEVDKFIWPEMCSELYSKQYEYFSESGRQLSAATKEGLNILAVTSDRRAEGRSTIALCLARCAAEAGVKVALFDADLEHPNLATKLQMAPGVGWEATVLEGAPLSESAITSTEDNLCLFPLTGKVANEPFALNDSSVSETWREAGRSFDLVVIDLGPLGEDDGQLFEAGEDCPVDAAIVVRDLRKTDTFRLAKIVEQLQRSGVDAVGVAENFAGESDAA